MRYGRNRVDENIIGEIIVGDFKITHYGMMQICHNLNSFPIFEIFYTEIEIFNVLCKNEGKQNFSSYKINFCTFDNSLLK